MASMRAACFFTLLPSLALAGELERGYEALKQKDYRKAITSFNAYIRDQPNDSAGYFARGSAYEEAKEYAKALADYSEAVRLEPDNSVPYAARGHTYVLMKDYDKAIRDYTEAIRRRPHDTVLGAAVLDLVYPRRGFAYEQKKEYDKAIADFSEAIRLDPKQAKTYVRRAYAYRLMKEYGKAIADYSAAGRLNPKDAECHNNLAWLLATCPINGARNGKQAVEHATRACELSSWKTARFLDSLAAAHAECGDFKEAVRWQQKAIELISADKAQADEYRTRLKLYQEGKPYRDK